MKSIAIRPTGFLPRRDLQATRKTAEVECNARSRLITIGQCLQKRHDRVFLVFC